MTSTPSAATQSIHLQALRPVVVVRMSAIGDTLLAARTHSPLLQRGYGPILLSHQNNASLLNCMPLLRGACLMSDTDESFWLRELSSEKIRQVSKSEFERALHHHTPVDVQQTSSTLNILDLQNTHRSKRAIERFERLFAATGPKLQIKKVAKLSFWRIVLVLWSFFSFRQRRDRTPPRWLKHKLVPVHTLQHHLVDTLAPQIAPAAFASGLSALSAAQKQQTEVAERYILFFVGASYRLKSWPRESFRTLLNLILAHTTCRIVLCGGSNDAAIGEYLTFPAHERISNCIGTTSLAETLGLIDGAEYVVTGDSFASHAADLLSRPASVIFGATHPLLGFAPVGNHTSVHHAGLSCSPCSRHGQGECRFKNLKCLTLVRPEEVFTKIMQTLNSGSQDLDISRQTPDS